MALDCNCEEVGTSAHASPPDIADRIATFVVERLKYDGQAADLLADPPVGLSEATDSMGLLELASYVEDEFGIAIADEDICRENFATVADVSRLVRAKRATAPANLGARE